MDIDYLKILFSILCFQLFFVAVFLIQSKKGKTLSNKLLSVVFLMLLIAVINFYLIIFEQGKSFPKLLFLDDTFMLAYGPLLYLFTQSVIFKDYSLGRKQLLHLLPFFISIVYFMVFVMTSDKESFDNTIDQVTTQNVPLFFRIVEMLILGHIFYYLYKAKSETKKVMGKTMGIYSSFNQDNFRLLQFILNSFLFLFVLSLVHSFLPFVGFKNGLFITLLLLILFMLYFVNAVLIRMLNQSASISGKITQTVFQQKDKYAASSLTKDDLQQLKDKLQCYMIDNERYLDSELSIDDLSREIDISSKLCSQVINEGFHCNFFDFVNKFRIEKAKSLLTNPKDEKQTISEVMYDAGFNSKSSFNTSFKKFTKKTPTQFKKEYQMRSTS